MKCNTAHQSIFSLYSHGRVANKEQTTSLIIYLLSQWGKVYTPAYDTLHKTTLGPAQVPRWVPAPRGGRRPSHVAAYRNAEVPLRLLFHIRKCKQSTTCARHLFPEAFANDLIQDFSGKTRPCCGFQRKSKVTAVRVWPIPPSFLLVCVLWFALKMVLLPFPLQTPDSICRKSRKKSTLQRFTEDGELAGGTLATHTKLPQAFSWEKQDSLLWVCLP